MKTNFCRVCFTRCKDSVLLNLPSDKGWYAWIENVLRQTFIDDYLSIVADYFDVVDLSEKPETGRNHKMIFAGCLVFDRIGSHAFKSADTTND